MAKQKLKIYKLRFTTPLHLGDNRDDYSISQKTISSDTMYAALISCLAKMREEIPLTGDLGCTISSLFPYYQKDKQSEAVLFFPKPLKQTLPTSDKAVEDRKKIKKVAWLDTKYFSKILNGEQLFDNNTIDNCIKGEFLTEEKIDKDFIVSQISQRVTVSRNMKEDAVPFYMDRISFKDHSGLYFVANGDTTLLDKAINLLQLEGIGTDRNVGNGYFVTDQAEEIDIDTPDNSEYSMSLSSFIPESETQLQTMLDSENTAYDFQRKGGWITTPPHNTLRKNVIYAFTAASVFKMCSNGLEAKGLVGVDLKPNWNDSLDHPVWRCGRALFVPIKLN